MLSGVTVMAIAVMVSGCVSTEQKAAWAHVQAARIIASQSPMIVRHSGDETRVTRVVLLRAAGRLAIAVQLRNLTARALSDLPLSVGLRRGNRRVYLNRRAGLDYFRTHVPEIPPGGAVTWVFTTRATPRLRGHAFAVAGDEAAPPVTVAHTIPQVSAVLSSVTPAAGSRALRIRVINRSAVPQTELQVYATVLSPGGYAAAGSATIADLGTGDSTTTTVSLVGRPRGSRVRLEALPTMF
jgi:hypothetical protein